MIWAQVSSCFLIPFNFHLALVLGNLILIIVIDWIISKGEYSSLSRCVWLTMFEDLSIYAFDVRTALCLIAKFLSNDLAHLKYLLSFKVRDSIRYGRRIFYLYILYILSPNLMILHSVCRCRQSRLCHLLILMSLSKETSVVLSELHIIHSTHGLASIII